jgi:hypothetical protein
MLDFIPDDKWKADKDYAHNEKYPSKKDFEEPRAVFKHIRK